MPVALGDCSSGAVVRGGLSAPYRLGFQTGPGCIWHAYQAETVCQHCLPLHGCTEPATSQDEVFSCSQTCVLVGLFFLEVEAANSGTDPAAATEPSTTISWSSRRGTSILWWSAHPPAPRRVESLTGQAVRASLCSNHQTCHRHMILIGHLKREEDDVTFLGLLFHSVCFPLDLNTIRRHSFLRRVPDSRVACVLCRAVDFRPP